MKTLAIALVAALASAAAVGSQGTFTMFQNERELAVELPVSAVDATSIVPFIEKAARERGITRVRAYDRDVFIPLEQATLSFVRNAGSLTMHVAVESEYRYAKADRAAALMELKGMGNAIFLRALQLQAASR